MPEWRELNPSEDLDFVRMINRKVMDILVKHDMEGHLDGLLSDETRSTRFMDAMIDIASLGRQNPDPKQYANREELVEELKKKLVWGRYDCELILDIIRTHALKEE